MQKAWTLTRLWQCALAPEKQRNWPGQMLKLASLLRLGAFACACPAFKSQPKTTIGDMGGS